MPAIVDHEPSGGGDPRTIFDSGAIMMYLAEKAGRFWPQETHRKYEVVQWILWQMANQGTKFGEQEHAIRSGKAA
jgi:GST-like protein